MKSNISLRQRAHKLSSRVGAKDISALLLCGFLALLLTGCGGGGSSKSTATGETSLQSTVVGNVSTANSPAATTSASIAASAIPVGGSVTQSSNVDGSRVTLDQVSATATYSGSTLRVSVTNGRTGSWGTVSSGDVALRTNNDLVGTSSGDTYRERAIGKRIGTSGLAVVDVFTDRLNAANTDYLVGGVWLYIPDGANPTPEIGAFVDGPDTNLTPAAYLTAEKTNATYQGDATGIYLGDDSGTVIAGEFVADVELTLDFGTSPTISGRVTNINEIDATRTSLDPVAGNPALNLGTASIASAAGGFFTGDTSGVDASSRNYIGKWGGQFYGDQAQKVGGTFGGMTDNADYDLSFVGAFGAKKN